MAGSAKTRHSGTTRKVAAIEHQPGAADIKQAEPVGMESSSSPGSVSQKAHDRAENAAKAARPAVYSALLRLFTARKRAVKTGSGFCFGRALLAGIAGGAVALAATAIILPVFSAKREQAGVVAGTRLAEELAELKSRLATIASLQAGAVPDAQVRATLAKAQESAAKTLAIAADAQKKARTALDAVAQMQQELAQRAGQAVPAEAEQSVVQQRISALEEQVAALAGLKKDIAAARAAAQNQQTRFEALKQEMESLARQGREADAGMALLAAANALKAAVDRGGSYAGELQAFAKIAPPDLSLKLLQDHAGKGLPSAGELSSRFATVADKIARTGNKAPPDAGISGRLWAEARAMVSARPVGNVEGQTPGAIAARMEVAIAAGDYARALAEWKTLPEEARAVSADFITALQARYEVDNFLSRFVARTLSPRLQSE